MSHVVLLGDSIFDNQVYVAPDPDVRHQLHARLGTAWDVTLQAVDGHVTADVKRQLQRVPESATHLVISVGGNDALGHVSLLGELRVPSRKRSSGWRGRSPASPPPMPR
jgi:lysophospholipase L1-like esterase